MICLLLDLFYVKIYQKFNNHLSPLLQLILFYLISFFREILWHHEHIIPVS